MYSPKNFRLNKSGIWPGNKRLKLPPYVFTDEITIAVDVAFATNRPLLVSGPPGSGKSILAPTLAAIKRWRFLHYTFTSRTRLEDLTGDLDQLRRLSDAQAIGRNEQLPPKWSYLEPGILWWAFNPYSASLRGADEDAIKSLGPKFQPPEAPEGKQSGSAVLLFDEIDKAEPDIPNDLLEPLDKRRFTVPQGPTIEASSGLKLLVIITTNGERELPPAFLRRCINLTLVDPDHQRLIAIAKQHFRDGDPELHEAVAEKIIEQRETARSLDMRAPSTGEFLDAIVACRELGIKPDPQDEVWQQIASVTLVKETPDSETAETDDQAW